MPCDLNPPDITSTCLAHTCQQTSDRKANKRKVDTEIALLQERLEKMTSIFKRMQEAKANREYHKMPGLKREQDASMGR